MLIFVTCLNLSLISHVIKKMLFKKKKYLKIRKLHIKMEQPKHDHQSVQFLTSNAAKGERH